MDKCRYHLDMGGVKTTFYSDKDLTEFVKNNISKSSDSENLAIKYSQSGGLKTPQDLAYEALDSVDAWNKSFISPQDFLKEEHVLGNESKLLSPYFKDENYSLYKVEELQKTFPTMSKSELLKQVEEELKKDNKVEKISRFSSKILKASINGTTGTEAFNNDIMSFINLIFDYNDETVPEEEILKNLKKDIIHKFNDFAKKFTAKNNIYETSQNVTTNDVTMKGSIDVLEIDSNGNPNIYDIRTSRKQFNDWDSAKKLTSDYLLGIKRQLLSNYINSDDAFLGIIEVYLPTTNDEKINIYGLSIDVGENRATSESPLGRKGTITNTLKTLLPSRIVRDVKTSGKLTESITGTLNAMFPKYQFRTKRIVTDIDKLVSDAIANTKGQKYVFISNNLDKLSEKIQEERDVPGWEDRFRKKVEEYIEKWNDNKDSWVHDVIKAITYAKSRNEQSIKLNKFQDKKVGLNKILAPYLKQDWVIINNNSIPELSEAGILLFRNNISNVVEAVSISINELGQINNLGLGTSLLGKFKKDDHVQHDTKILKSFSYNIEAVKVLTVLNHFSSELKGTTLNHITIFNPWSDKGEPIPLKRIMYNYDLLIDQVRKANPEIPKFKIKASDTWEAVYTNIFTFTNNSQDYRLKKNVESFKVNEDTMDSAYGKQQWFTKLRDKMLEEYPELSEVDQSKVPDFKNEIFYVYYLVSLGISYYAGLTDVLDYDYPRWGISWGDATHLIKTVVMGNAPEKSVGLFQGSQFATTDSLPSELFTKLFSVARISQNNVINAFGKIQPLITKASDSYYNSIGRSDLQKVLIGNADKYHKPLYEDFNGKIDQELKLMNPWDNSNKLNLQQREYLKKILFIFYQYGNPKHTFASIDELEKSPFFKEITDDSTFFMIPLAKKVGLSKWNTNLTTDGFRKTIGKVYDDFKDELDVKGMTEEQRTESYNSTNGFKRMYNQFDSQKNPKVREGLIEKHGVDFFEINLDTLALKYTFERIREQEYNKVLPNIQNATMVLKFFGWQTNKSAEVENALKDFWDQMKTTIYGESIIDEEVKDAIAGIKKIQKVASMMAIALRPALLIKEMVVGSIKNVSFAWSKVYGDDTINEKTLSKAYKIVVTPNTETINLLDALNMEYRFVNYDLNRVVTRKKVDRYGLEFAGDYLYWFNRAPDYVNRMSLFVAKMIHDGSLDAHSLNSDGVLVYEPSKDKRYSYYFEKRKLYKLEYHKSDNLYNEQRSLYLTALEQYNTEQSTQGNPALKEGEKDLPQAYTAIEKDSIKNFSDTAYGFYDHELSPLAKHGAIGTLFGQFLGFWPAKIKYYFGPPGQNTPRGKMTQKYVINEDGTKTLLWRKEEVDENGEVFISEIPENELSKDDPRVPATVWDGHPSEGLMYSLGLTFREIVATKSLKNVPQHRLNRAKLATHDLFMAMIWLLLGHLMYSKNEEGKIPMKQMEQSEQLAMKILMKSTGEFDPISALFGTLSWTPAFVSIMGNAAEDFKSVISGDSDLESFLRQNIRLMEALPEIK